MKRLPVYAALAVALAVLCGALLLRAGRGRAPAWAPEPWTGGDRVAGEGGRRFPARGAETALPADVSAAGDGAGSAAPAASVETRAYSSARESVVINEIHYHPSSDDRRDEWIEIHNRGTAAVALGGWRLAGAVELAFPYGTSLAPGAYLVAGADHARLARVSGLEGALGDWTGSLGDGGETVHLLDETGAEADAVAYTDRPPFPVLADGLGRSLERRNPHVSSSAPANWGAAASPVAAGWRWFEATGTATSSRLYFYLLGAGTAYVDDVVLERLDGAREGAAAERWEDDFEDDASTWSFLGTHSRSSASAERARSGRRSLKVVAGASGSGRASAAARDFPGVRPGGRYRLEFRALLPESGPGLVARFSSGGTGNPGLVCQTQGGGGSARTTPGRPNSILAANLPPFVFPLTHDPPRPSPGARVTVRATVAASGAVRAVLLHCDDGRGERSLPLRDDGVAEHGDATAGDGIFSAALGPFPAGTLVRYRVEAEDERGERGAFPFAESPTSVRGFLVEEPKPPEGFPRYQLFLGDNARRALESDPHSDTYQRGTFVHDGRVYPNVGIRYRGQTSRFLPKHHWKVKFPKDDPFLPEPGHAEVRGLNLQSSAGDKTYLREMLGYNLWRDLGEPYLETWHALVSLNGEPLGLYLYLENPNDDFLERNGLEKGWLWKSYSGARAPGSGFELEVGEAEAEAGGALLDDFVASMNSLPRDELEAYIRERVDVDSFVNYLAACQLIHSADHVEKNYLVHADPAGRFRLLPWDLDLTHGRNFECSGGGIWNDTIRHDLWDPDHDDRELLFATRAHPKCEGRWNGVIDGFLGRTAAFRPLYYRRLAEHLAHYYHPDVLLPKIARLAARIREAAVADRERWGTYGRNAGFDHDVRELERWVRRRHEYLRAKLEALGYATGEPLNADFESDRRSGRAPLRVRFSSRAAGKVDAWEWDFGDGARSDSRDPEHLYERPGRHDVTLKVSGPAGSHAAARRRYIFVAE